MGWSERLLVARFALRRALRRAARNLARFFASVAAFGARAPTRLSVVPQDLRTADPTMAADIYAGHFVFAGHSVSTGGASPFEMLPPSRAWAEALYGMGWLRHLRAADTALARANARTLVDDFMRRNRDRDETASKPIVMSRRLQALLCHAAMIAEGADHAFYGRFVRHLGQTARRLAIESKHGLTERERLAAAIGCAYAGLCLDRMEGLARRASRRLASELDWQILPDGGHVSRNPGVLVELLLDLLPLRSLYAAKGVEPPRELSGAIDRIMPQLRMFRHGDGALALFNGMGGTQPDTMATLLAYDDARAQPMAEARYSGYVRLDAEGAVVIVDVGRVLDPWCSAQACAAPLAFEFSSGRQRLIVNCGALRSASPELERATRSTPAHSTLVLDDRSLGHFVGIGGEQLLFHEAGAVSCRRELAPDGGHVIEASHDGYVASFGFVHERQLRLAANGRELAGQERLAGEPNEGMPIPGVLRFHLHPSVTCSSAGDGAAAILVAPGHETWLFDAGGLPVGVEDSMFFAGPDGARRSSQIVVSFEAQTVRDIRWRFQRVEPAARPRSRDRDEAAPQLL